MNYIISIIVVVIILSVFFVMSRQKKGNIIFGQIKKKRENKVKILEFMKEHKKVRNNDVENLLKVSDATATRYLNELEKEGKIRQIGTVGQAVYYVQKERV